jgi:hypothetical protein
MTAAAATRRVTQMVEAVHRDAIDPAALVASDRPIILRGFVKDWPLVAAGRQGPAAAIAYLKHFYRGRPVAGYTGLPENGGRYFYEPNATQLNFKSERVALDAYLDRLADQLGDPQSPSFYVGSTDLDLFLPGIGAENSLGLDDDAFGGRAPIVSIWLGNRTTAPTHYDQSHNIACCAVGRRRFTLFPPDQATNLYPGPLEPTPGGQVVSMVDLNAPDFDRYPRFKDALATAQVAELEAGDILFYPALWWHQVEALDPFNAMINYWWSVSPAFMDTPQTTLLHAILSLRDRPEGEKAAWRHLFDHYVFGPAGQAAAHLPEAAQGALAPLDEMSARRLRAAILHKINR